MKHVSSLWVGSVLATPIANPRAPAPHLSLHSNAGAACSSAAPLGTLARLRCICCFPRARLFVAPARSEHENPCGTSSARRSVNTAPPHARWKNAFLSKLAAVTQPHVPSMARRLAAPSPESPHQAAASHRPSALIPPRSPHRPRTPSSTTLFRQGACGNRVARCSRRGGAAAWRSTPSA